MMILRFLARSAPSVPLGACLLFAAPPANGGGAPPLATLALELLTPSVVEGERIQLAVVITTGPNCPLDSDALDGEIEANFSFGSLGAADLGSVDVQNAVIVEAGGFPPGAATGTYVVFVPNNDFLVTQFRTIVTIDTVDDALVESDETVTFHVFVEGPVSGDFSPELQCQGKTSWGFMNDLSNPVTVTVVDNDVAQIYEISVGDAEPVVEGDSGSRNAEFTIVSEPPIGIEDQLVVSYEAEPGTATPGVDFSSLRGSITLDSSQPRAAIPVEVLGDTLVEEDETFFLRIRTASQIAFVRRSVGAGRIIDDDEEQVRIEASPVAFVEGDAGTTLFAFRLRALPGPPAGDPVVVSWATRDGTATSADGDYVAASGTVSFAAGGAATQVVSVQVRADTRVEPDEELFLDLGLVSGNGVVSTPSVVGTIRNDDESSLVSFASSRFSATEEGTAVVVVRRGGSYVRAAEVTARTIGGGTAAVGEDFTAKGGRLRWEAGDSSVRFLEIPILADNREEDDETVVVALLDPTGASLDAPRRATVAIVDDDEPRNLEIVGEAEPTASMGEHLQLLVVVTKVGAGPIGY